MSMSHSRPAPEQLARWEGFPDTSLGISGVVTHGRCWHRSTECSLYRATGLSAANANLAWHVPKLVTSARHLFNFALRRSSTYSA
jgi:hypothetical protein